MEFDFSDENPYAPPRSEPEPQDEPYDEENDIFEIEYYDPGLCTGSVRMTITALYPVVFFIPFCFVGGCLLLLFIALISIGGMAGNGSGVAVNVFAFLLLLVGFAVLYRSLRRVILTIERKIYTRIAEPLHSQVPQNATAFLVHLTLHPIFRLLPLRIDHSRSGWSKYRIVAFQYFTKDIGLVYIEDGKLCFIGDSCRFSLPRRALYPRYPYNHSYPFIGEKGYEFHLRKSVKHDFTIMEILPKGESDAKKLADNGKQFCKFILGWLQGNPDEEFDY